MIKKRDYTINLNGHLMNLNVPKVMGILNVTPDSFHSFSRCVTDDEIKARFETIVKEGGDIIDIGGCSTRPGSQSPSLEIEWDRVSRALSIYQKMGCKLTVSIDTFRSEIAKRAVEEYGVNIINDVSGGALDPYMWPTVAELHVPYVLTHMRGCPENMLSFAKYGDVTAEVIKELSWKAYELHKAGICDIIIDPGFGFSKNIEQNFRILKEMEQICNLGMPVLVGVSRKSMVTKFLNIDTQDSLPGTIVFNTIALLKGASILRVHDVKEAVETMKIVEGVFS